MTKEEFLNIVLKREYEKNSSLNFLVMGFESSIYKNHFGVFVAKEEHIAVLNYGGAEYMSLEKFVNYVAKRCKFPNITIESFLIEKNYLFLNGEFKKTNNSKKIKL